MGSCNRPSSIAYACFCHAQCEFGLPSNQAQRHARMRRHDHQNCWRQTPGPLERRHLDSDVQYPTHMIYASAPHGLLPEVKPRPAGSLTGPGPTGAGAGAAGAGAGAAGATGAGAGDPKNSWYTRRRTQRVRTSSPTRDAFFHPNMATCQWLPFICNLSMASLDFGG